MSDNGQDAEDVEDVEGVDPITVTLTGEAAREFRDFRRRLCWDVKADVPAEDAVLQAIRRAGTYRQRAYEQRRELKQLRAALGEQIDAEHGADRPVGTAARAAEFARRLDAFKSSAVENRAAVVVLQRPTETERTAFHGILCGWGLTYHVDRQEDGTHVFCIDAAEGSDR